MRSEFQTCVLLCSRRGEWKEAKPQLSNSKTSSLFFFFPLAQGVSETNGMTHSWRRDHGCVELSRKEAKNVYYAEFGQWSSDLVNLSDQSIALDVGFACFFSSIHFSPTSSSSFFAQEKKKWIFNLIFLPSGCLVHVLGMPSQCFEPSRNQKKKPVLYPGLITGLS
jgi:hypothetical protein